MNSFVLTLEIAAEQQLQMDTLRKAHFPPHLNRIPAHITLFHTLPAEKSGAVEAELRETADSCAEFAMEVTGLRHLGKGVAYVLRSPELLALHARLAAAFADDLTSQDRQRYAPHIVIQNKVEPAASKELHRHLGEDFAPFPLTATGLLLWRYLGGPWELAERYGFKKVAPVSGLDD